LKTPRESLAFMSSTIPSRLELSESGASQLANSFLPKNIRNSISNVIIIVWSCASTALIPWGKVPLIPDFLQ
jgi:hypothetical protein